MKKKELSEVEKLQLKLNNIKQNAKYEFTWNYEDMENLEKLIQKVNILEAEHYELESYKTHYSALRKHWDKIIDVILGEDYYNMGCDTFTCDDLTCEDIIYDYYKSRNIFKKLFHRRR